MPNGKWLASIIINREIITLGRFEKEKDAAVAYNIKALELFGEFARINEILE